MFEYDDVSVKSENSEVSRTTSRSKYRSRWYKDSKVAKCLWNLGKERENAIIITTILGKICRDKKMKAKYTEGGLCQGKSKRSKLIFYFVTQKLFDKITLSSIMKVNWLK